MAEPLRHRQTKEAATDMLSLQPPRHIPTLPKTEVAALRGDVCFAPVGSTGRRNTGIKSLCWRFKLQGLTWPFV